MSSRIRLAASAAHLPVVSLLPPPIAPVGVILAVTLLVPLVLASAGLAQVAPAHRSLDPEEVSRLGLGVEVARRVEGAQLLVSVRPGRGGDGRDARLLAAAPGGARVALADRLGPGPAQLLVTRPDGGATTTAMDGLLGAAFAPSGAWVAAVDGTGALWRVEPDDGAAVALADGPFAGALEFAPDGRLLLLLLSSVDVPTSSLPVLVDPETGTLDPVPGVAEDALVYRARSTAEGVALVLHRHDGSKELRLAGAAAALAALPAHAGTIDFAPDLSTVAYRSYDAEVTLLHLDTGELLRLSAGAQPRFSPDGTRLMVTVGDETATLDVASGDVTAVEGQAVWADCDGECRP